MRRVYDLIKESFQGCQEFTTQEVYKAFSDMKKNTLSWYLHMLVQKNYIKSIRHGVYGFYQHEDTIYYEQMQRSSREAYDLMRQSGLGFYLSGWDGLLTEKLNPAAYPIIMVVERGCMYDVVQYLTDNEFRVYHDGRETLGDESTPDDRKVLLMRGSNMDFGEYGVACAEKGFADLYYAVTRMGYPTASEQLVEMQFDFLKRGIMSVARLKDSAKELGIKTEFEFMLQMALLPDEAANFFIHGLMSERA